MCAECRGPADCDDGNPCTIDTCEPTRGCGAIDLPDGTDCGDADQCNGDETCLAGACEAGSPLDCDDGDDCTADACHPDTGCAHFVVDSDGDGFPDCEDQCPGHDDSLDADGDGIPDGCDTGTCEDGEQNGDELGVDCGGRCEPCGPDLGARQGCLQVMTDTFERADGPLAGTSAEYSAAEQWVAQTDGESNSLVIESGYVKAINDGPYASIHYLRAGMRVAYDNLRMRMRFRYPSAPTPSHEHVSLGIAEADSLSPDFRMGYHPNVDGGIVFIGETGSDWWQEGGFNAQLSGNTDYYLQLDVDASGTAAQLRLTTGDYYANGGAVVASVHTDQLAADLALEHFRLQTGARDLTTAHIEEVSVERCASRGWFYYPGGHEGGWEIFAVRDDDEAAERVVRITDFGGGSGSVGYPTLSPDGQHIAFERSRDIWRMTPDGATPTYVTVGSVGLGWVNDRELVYGSFQLCSENISRIDALTPGTPTTVYDASDAYGFPRANPDNPTQLLVSRWTCAGFVGAYVLDVAGSPLLTGLPEGRGGASGHGGWSPDGSLVAYPRAGGGVAVAHWPSASLARTALGAHGPTFGNDGARIYHGDDNGDIQRWDFAADRASTLAVGNVVHHGEWMQVEMDIDRDGDGLANGIDATPDG